MSQPAWLAQAWAELGQREVGGRNDNPHILSYFRELGFSDIEHDEVAWCAAFVGACLERSGLPSTRQLLARSYLDYGEKLDEPRVGAIAILSRGGDASQGHVGFCVGEARDKIFLLGGNQGDAVTVEGFDHLRVLAIRWPDETSRIDSAPEIRGTVETETEIFELALTHVLKMEGGWTEDPYDPGGPTNAGITLADYARWRNVSLDEASAAALGAELKSIPHDTVRKIYASFYWRPSHANELRPSLAIMHFDASVNHGLAGAARMLQRVLGVSADGEIGPRTLAAAGACDLRAAVGAYAGQRRASYRSLATFWRFGRGWLARIAATEKLAISVLDRANLSTTSKGIGSMSTGSETTQSPPPDPASAGKWWGQSVTIWGTLITALSTVLPALAPLLGLNLSAETIHQLGAETLTVCQALGGLIGTVLTIYGRARAAQPLLRRDLTVRI